MMLLLFARGSRPGFEGRHSGDTPGRSTISVFRGEPVIGLRRELVFGPRRLGEQCEVGATIWIAATARKSL